MKGYTDINQSRKLAEILPLESADMYYPWDTDSKSFLNIPIVKDNSYYLQGSIDCWSLAALLNIIRKSVGYTIEGSTNTYISAVFGEWKYETNVYDNEVDACVEMIRMIHRRGYLK